MKTNKIKTAIYIRVASHNQQKRKSDDQEKQLRTFASSHGYTVDEKYIYREMGYSGILPVQERPQLRKVIEDARNNGFRVLMIRDISRLFRKTIPLLNFLEELNVLGVKVVTTMGGSFDMSIPQDRFVATLMTSMAEMELHQRQGSMEKVLIVNKKTNGRNSKKAN